MKKRILFVMSQFNMGGIEKELLCLLDSIDRNRYIPELYLTGSDGELESQIPDYVTVYYPNCDVKGNVLEYLRHGRVWSILKIIYCYLRLRLSKGCAKDYWSVKVGAVLPNQYDCAVAYDGLDMAVISMAEEVNAKTRILWEHGPLIGVDEIYRKYSKKASKSFDKIVCVSEALKREFAEEYQLPDNRLCVLYNLVNVPAILRQADMEISDMLSGKGYSLVTVGRLHHQKGQEMIPQVTRMLLDAGYDIYWYLVGDGVLRQEIETQCAKLHVTERVILLGSKNNPYPYIKKCDIYVQTSSWEGWGLTIQEARILRKPMVVTPLPVSYEQIVNDVNGLIANDMRPESMFESIKLLLDHPEMQERFVCELEQEKHENLREIHKLYEIIESVESLNC